MAQPENNLMNMSMTRSIYIGIDKTAEVLKRKEAAEKELLARYVFLTNKIHLKILDVRQK